MAEEFLAWCASAGVPSIAAVEPEHVATWIEAETRELSVPSVKQRLAALRHLFDWLVNGQVVPIKPAHTMRGPRHVVTSGQTPVLDPTEARALLDSIDVSAQSGLRDRALIGLRPLTPPLVRTVQTGLQKGKRQRFKEEWSWQPETPNCRFG